MDNQTDQYFLSGTNPIANVDQRDLELTALRLAEREDVRTAARRARVMWERVYDHVAPAEQRHRLDEAIASYCFKAAMLAAGSDANYPRVLRVYSQEAEWLGHKVPSSKWGGDNPNNAYRVIPVAAGGQYRVHGRRQPHPSTYVTYQLVGDTSTSITLGSLEQSSMEIAADGSYDITLDETASNGRRNHLTIAPDTLYLFIRDSMGDWEHEAPDALRVYRNNSPSRAPLTDDEMAQRVTRSVLSDLFYAYYACRLFYNAPQMMRQPEGAGAVGGLVTQQGSLGYFTIADDEAIIITANSAGASYRSIVLHDAYLCSLPNRNNQISLNNAQMRADADGRYTYVISIADPGVHNWLDTTGFHDTLVLQRWQGLPETLTQMPAIEYKRAKLANLEAALPAGVAHLNKDERVAQLFLRQRSYDRRFSFDRSE